MMKLRIVRPVYWGGIPQEVGAEIEVESRADSAMLVHSGKAVAVNGSPASGPLTTVSSGLVAGAKPAKADKKGPKE